MREKKDFVNDLGCILSWHKILYMGQLDNFLMSIAWNANYSLGK